MIEYYHEPEKAYYTPSSENFMEIDKTTTDSQGKEKIESFECSVYFPTLIKISESCNIKPEDIAEYLQSILPYLNINQKSPLVLMDKIFYITKNENDIII